MKLRVHRPAKATLLGLLALAGAASVLVGVGRWFGVNPALILGGLATVAFALLTDAD